MARDTGLEELVRQQIGDEPGLFEKNMFGGRCWLLDGHLLCAARHDGLLLRLGKEQEAYAVTLPDIEPMENGGRPMRGWVWLGLNALADDRVRNELIVCALRFVRSLPPKQAE